MPSKFRNLNVFNGHRLPNPVWGWDGDHTCGAFQMTGPCGMSLRIIASSGLGWDHVSVSTERRCPNWEEMEWVKRRFWVDDAVVMQLHVPADDHVNHHPYCLHLWRPLDTDLPRPPAELVGPKS